MQSENKCKIICLTRRLGVSRFVKLLLLGVVCGYFVGGILPYAANADYSLNNASPYILPDQDQSGQVEEDNSSDLSVQTALPVILNSWEMAALPSNVLWLANHESGSFSEWQGDNSGTISITGEATADISTRFARSGRYSGALTIYNADGTNFHPGVRLTRYGTTATPNTLPNDAYYSVWYYFPQKIKPVNSWNVFQWKRRYNRDDGTSTTNPTYVVNVGSRRDGSMYFYLFSHIGNDGGYDTEGRGKKASSSVNIPLNRWVHFECSYRWSTTANGRVTCWQDGAQIMDVPNVITEFNYGNMRNPRSWTVNNYSNHTNPTTHVIYVDDAVISSSRLGPNIVSR